MLDTIIGLGSAGTCFGFAKLRFHMIDDPWDSVALSAFPLGSSCWLGLTVRLLESIISDSL